MSAAAAVSKDPRVSEFVTRDEIRNLPTKADLQAVARELAESVAVTMREMMREESARSVETIREEIRQESARSVETIRKEIRDQAVYFAQKSAEMRGR